MKTSSPLRLLDARPLLWLVLAGPALWILIRYALEIVSYGQVIHSTGDLSVQLLIVTLAATPLRLMLPRVKAVIWLMRRRRDFGVASFAYALIHLVVYLVRKADPGLILEEAAEWGMVAGWAAMLIYLPLAATSNNASVRWLSRNWKRLHRLVYPAAVLALLHWWLTAFDQTLALIHIATLALLEAARIALQIRRTISR